MAGQSTESSEQQSQQSRGEATTGGSERPETPPRGGIYAASPLTGFFRMDPFSLMRRMSEEIDRAFAEAVGRKDVKRTWTPAAEVFERGNNYVVRAELPGVSPADVKLEVTDDAIVLQGERKEDPEEAQRGVQVSERRYGPFYRTFPLPEGAKAEEAKAKFENGVLEVTVPIEAPKSTRREIPIEGTAPSASQQSTSSPQGGSEKAA